MSSLSPEKLAEIRNRLRLARQENIWVVDRHRESFGSAARDDIDALLAEVERLSGERLPASPAGRDAGEVAKTLVADWNDRGLIMDGDRTLVIAKLTTAILSERAEAEKMRKALTRIVALDEAMGHELTWEHASEAVAIAARALASPSPGNDEKETNDGR